MMQSFRYFIVDEYGNLTGASSLNILDIIEALVGTDAIVIDTFTGQELLSGKKIEKYGKENV